MANMKYSTYRVSLDLQKHQSQVSIAVFQYDTAVRLCISLTDGGNPYTIPIEDGYRAVFYAKRPDNTPLCHNCTIESNSRIIYDFQDSTAAVRGITNCQLRLYGADGGLITAPRFIIVVDERVVTEGLIELDDDELSAIDAIFTKETAREEAEAGRVQAEKARVEAEASRVTAETSRANAEAERVEAETARSATFIALKNEMDYNEQRRIEAETAREEAEAGRVQAEAERGKNCVLKESKSTQTIKSNLDIEGTGKFTSLKIGNQEVISGASVDIKIANYVNTQLGDIADRLDKINNGGGANA